MAEQKVQMETLGPAPSQGESGGFVNKIIFNVSRRAGAPSQHATCRLACCALPHSRRLPTLLAAIPLGEQERGRRLHGREAETGLAHWRWARSPAAGSSRDRCGALRGSARATSCAAACSAAWAMPTGAERDGLPLWLQVQEVAECSGRGQQWQAPPEPKSED